MILLASQDMRGSFDRLIRYDFSIPACWDQPATIRLHAQTADLWRTNNDHDYRENGMTYRGRPKLECEAENPEELAATAAYRWVTNLTQCIFLTSHNTPFRTEMYTFLFGMVHCGIRGGDVTWSLCRLKSTA